MPSGHGSFVRHRGVITHRNSIAGPIWITTFMVSSHHARHRPKQRWFLSGALVRTHPKTSPTTVPPPFSMTTFPEVCEVQMSLLKANISAIQHQSEFQQRLQQTPDLFRLSSWGLEIRLHESEETDWAFNLGPLFRDHMPLCTAFTAEDRLEQQKWQAKYAPLDSPDSIMLPCWIEIDAKDISYQGPQENLFFKIHPKATTDAIKNALIKLYPQHHWEKAWPPIESFSKHLPAAADFSSSA